MAQVQYPTINGFAHEFNTARILIKGKEYVGVTSIDYDTGLEPGEARGTHPQVLSRTRGQHKATASFEMLKKDAQALLSDLGAGFGAVVFDIVCSFPGDPEDPVDMVSDKIRAARITKVSQSAAEGTDAIKMKFELHPLDVLLGGLSIVPDSIY